MSAKFEKQYDEEAHLFGVVGPRFRKEGRLNAYDFFLIVRWKANRAISKVARRLVSVGGSDLERAVSHLTGEVFRAKDARGRFCILLQRWRLRLPIASAVPTVLYPEDFTVYDVRACNELKAFHALAGRHGADGLWSGYLEFKAAVVQATPPHLSLRDKDRFLWARSRHNDLVLDIAKCFGVAGVGTPNFSAPRTPRRRR